MKSRHQITKNSNFWTSAGASPSSGTRLGAGVCSNLRLLPPLTFLMIFLAGVFFNNSAYAAYSAGISRTSSGTIALKDGDGSSIKPSYSGTLGTGSDTVSVSSNCTAGYNLYVSAISGGSTNLSTDGGTDYIPSTTTATGSEATLTKDTWGVGKNGSTFSKLPAYSTDASTWTALYTGTGDSSSTAKNYTVYYGANVSTAKTPGTYTGDVLYTVIMNSACEKYTLKFDDDGATTINLEDQQIAFDTEIDLAEISSTDKIAKTGYHLTGWKDQNNKEYGITGKADVNPNDLSVVTLTAQWTKNSYAVTVNKGTNVTTVTGEGTYNYGSAVSVAATAFETGYHFSSWTVNSGGVTLYSNSAMTTASTTSTPAYFKMPGTDVTVTANAAANTYTFSYNVNGGSGSPATSSNTGTYGGNVTTSNTGTMAKTGYHLLGWATSSTATSATCSVNASCSVSMLASNAGKTGAGDNGATITLYAVWAKNTFTVNYSANGGTGSASKTSETATYGTNVTMPTKNTLAKSGYDFLGWSLSSTATSATWTANTGVAPTSLKSNVTTTNGGSVTVYAVWKSSTPYMQTTSCSSLTAGSTTTLYDSRDEQSYTVYRWPSSGTAGTAYPTAMAGYCMMTKDLGLGYVTGGSITKGSDLKLTTADSMGSGTIEVKTSNANWSVTNSDSILQYINGTNATYGAHGYYSYGAAQKVCPKGWRPPTNDEYNNIITFMGGNNAASSTKLRGSPYNFTLGGIFTTASWGWVGSAGFYWSSTQSGDSNAYYFSFDGSNVRNVAYYKNYGRPVRCIKAP